MCPAPVLSVPVGSLADVALALYRKYRPAKFAEVVGQEHVTQPLSVAIEAGRINHAYLFSGPRGCGKTSSARILARSLNCELGPTPEPCGVCSSCVSLAPGGPGNIDVTELDAASHGGVDDTRELRDRAFFAPAESRYRVFIVDEAHMITTQGFNALLKIVEEPPEHLVFVFATTEPEKVLPTIRSRTHHYPFRLIPPGTLRKLLERICAEEEVTVAPAVYPLVIRAGGGSARDSLSVLDQLVAGAGPEGVTYERAVALLGVTDVSLIDDVVDALAAGDRAAVFEAVDRLVEAGHDPRRFASRSAAAAARSHAAAGRAGGRRARAGGGGRRRDRPHGRAVGQVRRGHPHPLRRDPARRAHRDARRHRAPAAAGAALRPHAAARRDDRGARPAGAAGAAGAPFGHRRRPARAGGGGRRWGLERIRAAGWRVSARRWRQVGGCGWWGDLQQAVRCFAVRCSVVRRSVAHGGRWPAARVRCRARRRRRIRRACHPGCVHRPARRVCSGRDRRSACRVCSADRRSCRGASAAPPALPGRIRQFLVGGWPAGRRRRCLRSRRGPATRLGRRGWPAHGRRRCVGSC